MLRNLLCFLTSGDREEHHNLGILVSFCKHCGEDFAGLVPRRMRLLAQKYLRDIPTSDVSGWLSRRGPDTLRNT